MRRTWCRRHRIELVTLALANLNGLTYYYFRWDKPLGVKEPIKLYAIGTDPPRTRDIIDVSIVNDIHIERNFDPPM